MLDRRLGLSAQIADIERIRRILGEERLLLIGHSFGGFLVTLSAEYDKTMATMIFFNPELVAEIVDDQGRLVWSRIAPRHFRSTTFLQYKSALQHAGFLTPTRLGGASAHSYDPDQDQWQWAL